MNGTEGGCWCWATPACLIPSRGCPEGWGDTPLLQGLGGRWASNLELQPQRCQHKSQKSHSWIRTMQKRLSHPGGQTPPRGCSPVPTAQMPPPATAKQYKRGARTSASHSRPASTQQKRWVHLPRRILHPTSFSHSHRQARGCPSRSRTDALSPATQTTDLIFLFLNTQRSSPSAANPTEQAREQQTPTERSLLTSVLLPKSSFKFCPTLRIHISHIPQGCKTVLKSRS